MKSREWWRRTWPNRSRAPLKNLTTSRSVRSKKMNIVRRLCGAIDRGTSWNDKNEITIGDERRVVASYSKFELANRFRSRRNIAAGEFPARVRSRSRAHMSRWSTRGATEMPKFDRRWTVTPDLSSKLRRSLAVLSLDHRWTGSIDRTKLFRRVCHGVHESARKPESARSESARKVFPEIFHHHFLSRPKAPARNEHSDFSRNCDEIHARLSTSEIVRFSAFLAAEQGILGVG